MSDDGFEHRTCAVCGRTLLAGERVAEYVTAEGSAADVCVLCKPRAEASGWLPAALAASRASGDRPRRRRGFGLRARFLRSSRGARAGGSSGPPPEGGASDAAPTGSSTVARPASEPGRSPAPRREQQRQPKSPPPAPPQPVPDRVARDAIEVFNDSREARKVAGLARSLGAPGVSVVPTGTAATITVAWELSWYQWRVADGRIEEIAKGSEIAELPDANRAWNAIAAEDGSLRLATGAPGEAGHAPEQRAGVAAAEGSADAGPGR